MSQPFIGGTAAAALAGVNPPGWAQPIDVYQQLRGEGHERAQSRMMAMGHLMEELVASLFTEATGIEVRRPAGRPERTCSYLHPEGGCTATRSRTYPWAGAHIDRWAGREALECKWSERRDEWGPGLGVGTAEAPVIIPAPGDPSYQPKVPLRYAVQVQHELAVTGRSIGYVAVLLGYGDFRWYALHRDQPMIDKLMELEERFWRENYLAGVPPAPDGSEAYGRALRRRYSTDDGEEAVATVEQRALVERLRLARRRREEAALEEERWAQLVQESMRNTAKLVGPGWVIHWRKQAPALRVRWEEFATQLVREGRRVAVDRGLMDAANWWPETKKAQAELVRRVALDNGFAKLDDEGGRPFRPEFASDESTEEG